MCLGLWIFAFVLSLDIYLDWGFLGLDLSFEVFRHSGKQFSLYLFKYVFRSIVVLVGFQNIKIRLFNINPTVLVCCILFGVVLCFFFFSCFIEILTYNSV